MELPLVGAALMSAQLPQHLDWLVAGQRDLEIQDACLPSVLDGDWRALARTIRSQLDGYHGRLGIHGPFLSLSILGYDPKVRALVSERLCGALEFGAEIGATHMVIHSPWMFFGHPQMAHAAGVVPSRTDDITLVHATLERVIEQAHAAGCTLVIENIVDTNPQPLLALVRSFESEHVRMSLDVGHALVAQRNGGPSPDQWVREAGAMLGHLHLQDGDGMLDRHWAPGQGSLNWFALFEALRGLHHAPRLVLELRDQARVLAAASWLAERGFVR